ncbi:hypothetical protein AXE80_12400 [Wenyingzhuangia fucanilytica]|uniref:Methyltransferase type 11 domain-containing protein n=1 Tax=Wenyingzhuangia fucanilytica TaxID=1790137 RepID=A0A1B1Y8E4_9FLAO|nr:class I SAM-dependent methyltransferase [Wenyingzhuangia fucanilytica]ANW97035.1 hypothetical protein AXE80_12400 [Wenyingzhuangia fucanilytica]
MKDTGERHILKEKFNSIEEYYNHLMHLKTYIYAAEKTIGKTVLDMGSGSGYGSKILSEKAKTTIGVDIDEESIKYANEHYSSYNTNFTTISNLENKKFDIITSFQVIEHVFDLNEYVKTISKYLKDDGLVYISTPNIEHRLFTFQHPWNQFHIKEFSRKSLIKLLSKEFESVEIYNIGSKTDICEYEIKRTKKLRFITFPLSLKIFPRKIKNKLLQYQSKIFIKTKKLFFQPTINSNKTDDFTLKYSINDIIITKENINTTDLLAVCKFKKKPLSYTEKIKK